MSYSPRGVLAAATSGPDTRGAPNIPTRLPTRRDAVLRRLRRDGLVGIARAVGERVRQRVWVTETHLWYETTPTAASQTRRLPRGASLIAGGVEDLHLLRALPTAVTEREASRRLAEGAQLWFVTRDRHTLFVCWLFRGSAPVPAAPGGRLELPDGIVVIEDVATVERHRGRGIAPAALAMITRRTDARESSRILAKVESGNRASRRAFRKAGFRAVAHMERKERGPFSSVEIDGSPEHSAVRLLADRLDSGAASDGAAA